MTAEVLTFGPEKPQDADYCTGWLAPNGDFYPCSTYEHTATAERIIENLYPDRTEEWDGYGVLYNRGFVHITGDCTCDMGFSVRTRRPNQRQIDILFDISLRADSYSKRNIMHFIKGQESEEFS